MAPLAVRLTGRKFSVNDHPLEVEIGFGNGEYLARISSEKPQVNFVGFEQYCERIHRTLRKLSRTGLDNVRVLRLDARAGLERYFSPKTIAMVHCLYPPPWPKKSDAKHRLFTADFLKLVNSRLVDGGLLKIVTDHHPYIEWIRENIQGTGFAVEFNNIPANYGTKFEKKWVEGGQSEFYELLLTKEHHIPVGLKEDSTLQSYLIDQFNPDNFGFKDYSHDGVAVSFKEILYDAKKKIALVVRGERTALPGSGAWPAARGSTPPRHRRRPRHPPAAATSASGAARAGAGAAPAQARPDRRR